MDRNLCLELEEATKERKWRWVGHTLRRDPTSITSQDRHSTGTPKGSAYEAVQPRLGEGRSLDTELRTYGISLGEAKHKAQDRTGWKTVVNALCSGRDEED